MLPNRSRLGRDAAKVKVLLAAARQPASGTTQARELAAEVARAEELPAVGWDSARLAQRASTAQEARTQPPRRHRDRIPALQAEQRAGAPSFSVCEIPPRQSPPTRSGPTPQRIQCKRMSP